VFETPEGAEAAGVAVTVAGAKVAAAYKMDGRDVCVTLAEPATLKAGTTLEATITLAK